MRYRGSLILVVVLAALTVVAGAGTVAGQENIDPEPDNNNISGAPVVDDGQYSGNINHCCRDYFQINLTAGEYLEGSVEFDKSRLEILGPDEKIIDSSTSSADRESVSTIASKSGPHYLHVYRGTRERTECCPEPDTDYILTINTGSPPVYSPSTGHYYEFVQAESISWTEARDAASQKTYQGMQGYLATVTSRAENDFITSQFDGKDWIGDDKVAADGLWIGASDAAEEGTWRWVTGPEGREDGGKGLHFFAQDLSDEDNGDPVGGNYVNWASKSSTEPNNQGENEDYAHYFRPNSTNGPTWNDNNNNRDAIDGYVVEYGGLENDTGGNYNNTVELNESYINNGNLIDSDGDGIPDIIEAEMNLTHPVGSDKGETIPLDADDPFSVCNSSTRFFDSGYGVPDGDVFDINWEIIDGGNKVGAEAVDALANTSCVPVDGDVLTISLKVITQAADKGSLVPSGDNLLRDPPELGEAPSEYAFEFSGDQYIRISPFERCAETKTYFPCSGRRDWMEPEFVTNQSDAYILIKPRIQVNTSSDESIDQILGEKYELSVVNRTSRVTTFYPSYSSPNTDDHNKLTPCESNSEDNGTTYCSNLVLAYNNNNDIISSAYDVQIGKLKLDISIDKDKFVTQSDTDSRYDDGITLTTNKEYGILTEGLKSKTYTFVEDTGFFYEKYTKSAKTLAGVSGAGSAVVSSGLLATSGVLTTGVTSSKVIAGGGVYNITEGIPNTSKVIDGEYPDFVPHSTTAVRSDAELTEYIVNTEKLPRNSTGNLNLTVENTFGQPINDTNVAVFRSEDYATPVSDNLDKAITLRPLESDDNGRLTFDKLEAGQNYTVVAGFEDFLFSQKSESMIITKESSVTLNLERSSIDVTIDSLDSSVNETEPITATATITNEQPESTSKTIEFRVESGLDGSVLGTDAKSVSLEKAGTKTVSFKVPTQAGDEGTYDAIVRSGTDSDTSLMNVQGPQEAEFSVNIDSTNSPVSAGETLDVYAEVTNTGDKSGTQTVQMDGGSLGNATREVSLSPEESDQLEFGLPTDTGDDGTYNILVGGEDDVETETVNITAMLGPDCSTVSYNGDGTVPNPYKVNNVSQLQCINNQSLTANYTQVSDIDASGTSEWNNGSGFEPIGNDSMRFTGRFKGQGYKITDLTINRSSEFHVGLFGAVGVGFSNTGTGGNITNVSVVNAKITGGSRTGGIAGVIEGSGGVYESYVTGEVSGEDRIGGLVGTNGFDGTVNESYSTADVSGSGFGRVGGLVGTNTGGDTLVSGSYATGSVNGPDSVGGLIGRNNATVTSSYATGSVNGSDGVGGLVGFNTFGAVSESYATGNVTGSSNTGGIVGGSYSTSVSDSYWDSEMTGQSSSDGGTGLKTSEMTGSAATTNMQGFDFTDTWETATNPDDYPILQWQTGSTGFDCPNSVSQNVCSAFVDSNGQPVGGLQLLGVLSDWDSTGEINGEKVQPIELLQLLSEWDEAR